jgi:hypothetical protein
VLVARIQSALVGACVLAGPSLGCGHAAPGAAAPIPAQAFTGVETDTWFVQEVSSAGRDDLLPAFEESARAYGCATSEIGADSSQNIHGERRSYYGISATCREGSIALITLTGGRVRIGCSKPTSLQACDALLRDISQAR